jgi:hypothetical protein
MMTVIMRYLRSRSNVGLIGHRETGHSEIETLGCVVGMPLEYSDNVLHDPDHKAIEIRTYALSPTSCE